MKIVISLLNFQLGQLGGGETYLRGLVAELPDLCRNEEIVLLTHRDNAAGIVVPGTERVVVDLSGREIMALRALEALSGFRARRVERVLEELKPDVVLFPQQAIFPKHVPCPCVLVVHDLNHLFFPRHLSLIQRWCRRWSCAYALEHADRIISDSHVTEKTIFEKCGTDPAKLSPFRSGSNRSTTGQFPPIAILRANTCIIRRRRTCTRTMHCCWKRLPRCDRGASSASS